MPTIPIPTAGPTPGTCLPPDASRTSGQGQFAGGADCDQIIGQRPDVAVAVYPGGMTASQEPVLNQLNIAVRNMDATVAFYRRLGLEIDAQPGAQHVAVHLANGVLLEFDTTEFVGQWNTGWRGATGGGVVLGFALTDRAAVDEVYANLTSAGQSPQQPPYDAFWGARYAIVEDPDGNPVGLMSPPDEEHRSWPPSRPPAVP